MFLDNIRYELIDPEEVQVAGSTWPKGATSASPGSDEGTEVSKNYASLTYPVSGPASGAGVLQPSRRPRRFVPTVGRVVSSRNQALLAATAFTKPVTTTVAPNSSATISMNATQKGIDAIKAAIKKPAKLKAQAKKLLKKAKELRAEGKIAKAQKLEKKAAKLIKRAKKLARKPLGVINTTITNPNNGISKVFTTTVKRP